MNTQSGGNGLAQRGILILIGVVVVSGVIGASVSGQDAGQIIGFCTLICVSLFGMLQSLNAAEKTAAKVEDASAVQAKKIETVAATVDEIVRQTNGMKTELVQAVKEASFAKGVISEKEKDAEKKEP